MLHIACPSRPRLAPFDIDTSHGKLSAFLDLKTSKDNHRMRALVKGADVFSQSYRPGKLTSLGFSPLGLAEMRPGTYFGPSLRLSETPPRWERTAQPLGAHFPVWADRQAKALDASFNS